MGSPKLVSTQFSSIMGKKNPQGSSNSFWAWLVALCTSLWTVSIVFLVFANENSHCNIRYEMNVLQT